MGKIYRTKAGTVFVAVVLVICLILAVTICITIAVAPKADVAMPTRVPISTPVPTVEPIQGPAERVDTEIVETLSESGFYGLPNEEKTEKIGTLLAGMEEEGLVSECEYDETQQLYYFTYADGTWGTIELNERSDRTNGTRKPGPEYRDRTDGLVYGEPCDIVVLNAFENTPYRRDFYEKAIQNWSEKAFLNVQYDTDVTVEDMRHLKGNAVVVFSMHGTVIRNIPALVLNEEPSAKTDSMYADDMKTHRIAKVIGESGTQYIILPSFFEETYRNDNLDGTAFFSESCDFFGDDGSSSERDNSFADALIMASADGVVGFRNSVLADYSRQVMEKVVSVICEGEAINNALDAALQLYGQTDGNGAYPLICVENGADTSSDSSAEDTELETTLMAEPVYNGQIFKLPEYACTCPLTVSVRGTDGYYIYLAYSNPPQWSYNDREPDTGNGGFGDDLSFYIAPGETVDLTIPIGEYRFFYCFGETWYGVEHKFGEGTAYFTSDEQMDFYSEVSGDQIVFNGHTLELWTREDGNMHSEPIDARSFPE